MTPRRNTGSQAGQTTNSTTDESALILSLKDKTLKNVLSLEINTTLFDLNFVWIPDTINPNKVGRMQTVCLFCYHFLSEEDISVYIVLLPHLTFFRLR